MYLKKTNVETEVLVLTGSDVSRLNQTLGFEYTFLVFYFRDKATNTASIRSPSVVFSFNGGIFCSHFTELSSYFLFPLEIPAVSSLPYGCHCYLQMGQEALDIALHQQCSSDKLCSLELCFLSILYC